MTHSQQSSIFIFLRNSHPKVLTILKTNCCHINLWDLVLGPWSLTLYKFPAIPSDQCPSN